MKPELHHFTCSSCQWESLGTEQQKNELLCGFCKKAVVEAVDDLTATIDERIESLHKEAC